MHGAHELRIEPTGNGGYMGYCTQGCITTISTGPNEPARLYMELHGGRVYDHSVCPVCRDLPPVTIEREA